MKFKILVDYGSEGHSFLSGGKKEFVFDTAQEAIDCGLSDKNYSSSPWQVVGIIDWKGVEIKEDSL